MTRRMTMFMTAAAAAAAIAAAPAQAAEESSVLGPQPDRAEQLREEAAQLYSQPRQWRRAARMLEQSAALRDASDAGAYSCLVMAGRLYAALGDNAAARQRFEDAASQALARGDVLNAAHAYVDAAHASARERQPDAAQSFMDRAALLTGSPLMTAQQVDQIARRIAAA
jgi:Tfp pilus assembly protein PilF